MDYYSGQQLDNMSVYQLLVADYYTGVFIKDDKTFRLGTKGYVVKRSKGKGASGFVAQKVV